MTQMGPWLLGRRRPESLHAWCCQSPREPSSCTTFTLSPHWARAATGEKETTRVYVCRAALVVSNPVAL